MASWFKELFSCEKAIIGMVHLLPLPGSPNYKGNMELVFERAMADALALKEGGVDGILVENFWDLPYKKVPDDPETVAAMAVVVKEIVKMSGLPVGINMLRNGGVQALCIAHVTGAKFIRVNVLTEAFVTDQGIIEGIAAELLRKRSYLNSDVKILADVHVKYAKPLYERPTTLSAKELVERGLADAVVVSGTRTGEPPNLKTLKAIKEAVNVPVIVGSGLNLGNVERYLSVADGAIVGTYFKRNGKIGEPVEIDRVISFMKKVPR